MKKVLYLGKSHSLLSSLKWAISIGIVSFFIAVFMSVISETILRHAGIATAFGVLLIIILIGVIFDAIGIAVAASTERSFHSMAANRVKGAATAVRVVRNAGVVSSVCNDVIGDICGIISGAASAIIIAQIAFTYDIRDATIMSISLSGVVAAITIGGKALGKEFGIKKIGPDSFRVCQDTPSD
ncbi:hypothetical protein [Peptoclostridium acidaminophilum]|uniref:hypothetical protein n=1 Tax=Peptoclostridium acidaminophilum TaxID=1731 RepID=UPI00130DF1BC|nr:hypothetical protein [Peptoclostridium acidaminophilum]